jgi:hypothetical protein
MRIKQKTIFIARGTISFNIRAFKAILRALKFKKKKKFFYAILDLGWIFYLAKNRNFYFIFYYIFKLNYS